MPPRTLFLAAALGLSLTATADPTAPAVPPAMSAAPDFRAVVYNAKKAVFPAVVFIRCRRESLEAGSRVTQDVSGSGVLITPDGDIATNWHVVDKAVEVRCLLHDGTACRARIIGSDKDTDVALLRLERPEKSAPLPYARIGRSDTLTEGDFVMAMGAPWGLSRSVTIGIISCTRRYLPEQSEYSCWLQTDASISPGNSGGPLVNTKGEVVGLNTLGNSMGGDLGFAVPAETLLAVTDRLRENGRVDRSWTGLKLQPLRDFNRDMNFAGDTGVIVADTENDSPARRAGLRPGDRLTTVDGASITALTEEDLPDLRRRLAAMPKDKPVPLALIRDGAPMTLEMTPGEKGRVEGATLDCPRWDFTARAINRFADADLYFQKQEGVFIFGIKDNGNAESARLQPGDILAAVDDRPVTTLDDLKRLHAEALARTTGGKRVQLTILRNGLTRRVVLDYTRDRSKE